MLGEKNSCNDDVFNCGLSFFGKKSRCFAGWKWRLALSSWLKIQVLMKRTHQFSEHGWCVAKVVTRRIYLLILKIRRREQSKSVVYTGQFSLKNNTVNSAWKWKVAIKSELPVFIFLGLEHVGLRYRLSYDVKINRTTLRGEPVYRNPPR